MTHVGNDNSGHAVWLWDAGEMEDIFETATPDEALLPTGVLFSNNGSPQTADFKFENGGYYDATGLLGNVITAAQGIATPIQYVAMPSQQTYNLQGQRVGKTYRGLVISNGKKYLVR